MDFNSFLSWEILATFAGVAACTGLLTQMLKSVTAKLPTQWLSYIIAVVLLVIVLAINGLAKFLSHKFDVEKNA